MREALVRRNPRRQEQKSLAIAHGRDDASISLILRRAFLLTLIPDPHMHPSPPHPSIQLPTHAPTHAHTHKLRDRRLQEVVGERVDVGLAAALAQDLGLPMGGWWKKVRRNARSQRHHNAHPKFHTLVMKVLVEGTLMPLSRRSSTALASPSCCVCAREGHGVRGEPPTTYMYT